MNGLNLLEPPTQQAPHEVTQQERSGGEPFDTNKANSSGNPPTFETVLRSNAQKENQTDRATVNKTKKNLKTEKAAVNEEARQLPQESAAPDKLNPQNKDAAEPLQAASKKRRSRVKPLDEAPISELNAFHPEVSTLMVQTKSDPLSNASGAALGPATADLLAKINAGALPGAKSASRPIAAATSGEPLQAAKNSVAGPPNAIRAGQPPLATAPITTNQLEMSAKRRQHVSTRQTVTQPGESPAPTKDLGATTPHHPAGPTQWGIPDFGGEKKTHATQAGGFETKKRRLAATSQVIRHADGQKPGFEQISAQPIKVETAREAGASQPRTGEGTALPQAEIKSQVLRAERSAPTSTRFNDVAGPRVPMPQVGAALKSFVLKGTNKVTIRLDPPELGSVHVDVEVMDKDVFLSLRTESAVASSELQAQLEQLREELKEQGLNLKEFELGQNEKDSNPDNDPTQQAETKKGDSHENSNSVDSAAQSTARGITADGRVNLVV